MKMLLHIIRALFALFILGLASCKYNSDNHNSFNRSGQAGGQLVFNGDLPVQNMGGATMAHYNGFQQQGGYYCYHHRYQTGGRAICSPTRASMVRGRPVRRPAVFVQQGGGYVPNTGTATGQNCYVWNGNGFVPASQSGFFPTGGSGFNPGATGGMPSYYSGGQQQRPNWQSNPNHGRIPMNNTQQLYQLPANIPRRNHAQEWQPNRFVVPDYSNADLRGVLP